MANITHLSGKKAKSANDRDIREFIPSISAKLAIIGRRYTHEASFQYNQLFGINIVDRGILNVLNKLPDLSARQLGEILSFDKALISRRLNFLNEAGYVKTQTCNNNKSRSQSCLTARGNKLHDKIAQLADELEKSRFKSLTETEEKTLDKLLSKLVENIRQESG